MTAVLIGNELWSVEIADPATGQLTTLIDRKSGRHVVGQAAAGEDLLMEGGHSLFGGLAVWLKCGAQKDPNTGVLVKWSPLKDVAMTVKEQDGRGVTLESSAGGLRLILTWELAEGEAPLRCRAVLTNESAAPDVYQFELFFCWNVPLAARADFCMAAPGLSPYLLKPFGDIHYKGGTGTDEPAVLWKYGTTDGVALRAGENVLRFFYGVQGDFVVLGAHSGEQRLEPGAALGVSLDIAPLEWAQEHDGGPDPATLGRSVREPRERRRALVESLPDLPLWVAPRGAPIFSWLSAHLTFQYAPVELAEAEAVIEDVLAPAGYNQVIMEIGRAFPFTSHPKSSASWAWPKASWQALAQRAADHGMEVVPQYNALAHQGESGLAAGYPELREDAGGWGLCPSHPDTPKFLCDLFDELLDVFKPRRFHVGMDECDVPSRAPTFGICPRCRERDGGELFAEHILRLHDHLTQQNVQTLMWADMLLHDKKKHNFDHGLRPGTHTAIDRLPRDIILCDWQYTAVRDYLGASRYLQGKGFRVMGCHWHSQVAIVGFTRAAAAGGGFLGMCQTSWTTPRLSDLPLAHMLLAARCGHDPEGTTLEQHGPEAEAQAFRAIGRREMVL